MSLMFPPSHSFHCILLKLVIFTLLLNSSAQICVPDNGRLLGENGEFNHEQFQLMMKGEIMRYFRRQLKKAVSLSESEVRFNLVGSLSLQMSSKCILLFYILDICVYVCVCVWMCARAMCPFPVAFRNSK